MNIFAQPVFSLTQMKISNEATQESSTVQIQQAVLKEAIIDTKKLLKLLDNILSISLIKMTGNLITCLKTHSSTSNIVIGKEMVEHLQLFITQKI